MSTTRTTYRLYDSAGVRCATAVSTTDGKILAVPEKIIYNGLDSWKAAAEEKVGGKLNLLFETRDSNLWNRPLTQLPGRTTAKKLRTHYENLNDDQQLILSLAHKHGLKETITPRRYYKPTRLYVQMMSKESNVVVLIAPVHFNRWGKLKVAYNEVDTLPHIDGKLVLFREDHGIYKQIMRFPSKELPPASMPVVILENKSHYFYQGVQDELKKLVDAGYYVEVVLGKRPNLGTNKRLAELYRRAEHKFTANYNYRNHVASTYTDQSVNEYLADRWKIVPIKEGQEWFKSDCISTNMITRGMMWRIPQRVQELAEGSVWYD